MRQFTKQPAAQSWYDFSVMNTLDPRSIVQTIQFEDQGGTMRQATFGRPTTYLHSGVWANPPIAPSAWGTTTTPNVTVPNAYDYGSQQEATAWNSLTAMTVPPTALVPVALQKVMFLKAGSAYINNIYLDFLGGLTANDIMFSFRDNSLVSGDFMDNPAGSIPSFIFPTGGITYGGTGRNLQVTLLASGRFSVGLRIVDSGGNWSLYEMEWIVLP
jgi:hypothetical protein